RWLVGIGIDAKMVRVVRAKAALAFLNRLSGGRDRNRDSTAVAITVAQRGGPLECQVGINRHEVAVPAVEVSTADRVDGPVWRDRRSHVQTDALDAAGTRGRQEVWIVRTGRVQSPGGGGTRPGQLVVVESAHAGGRGVRRREQVLIRDRKAIALGGHLDEPAVNGEQSVGIELNRVVEDVSGAIHRDWAGDKRIGIATEWAKPRQLIASAGVQLKDAAVGSGHI